MNEMFGIDFTDKSVLDMGSGTGVLAILAAKLGASSLIGIDFDEWAFENAVENAELNSVENIKFIHGDADAIGDDKFDIILANINRNIILQDIDTYVGAMNLQSEILFSGFLKEDIPLILEKSEQLGLELVDSKHKNKWQMLHLKKA
jgi:ribosomal protein L11 methyltransferase